MLARPGNIVTQIAFILTFLLCFSAMAVAMECLVHYSFDNISGDTVHDESNNKSSGTVHGNTARVYGKVGQAFEFTGSNHISIPLTAFPQNAGTWMCWMKWPGNRNKRQGRLFCSTNSKGPDHEFRTYGKENLSWYACNDYGEKKYVVVKDIPTDEWFLVAYTWEYDQQMNRTLLTPYGNGKMGTQAWLNGKIAVPDAGMPEAKIMLGCWHKQYFIGAVDELFIYDYALSHREIEQKFGEPCISYSFEGISGGVVSDRTDYKNHGTVHGDTAQVYGKVGQAFEFTGSNHISVPLSAFSQDAGTWICWVKRPASLKKNKGRLFNSIHNEGRQYEFRTYGATNLSWHVCNEYGEKKYVTVKNLPTDEWSLVAFTWKYDPKEKQTLLTAYGNGEVGTQAWLKGEIKVPDADIRLGCWNDQYFIGAVDEFRLYNYALSDEVISDMWEEPIIDYRFEERYEDMLILDASPNYSNTYVNGNAERVLNGKIDKGLRFDGVDDSILLSPALFPQESGTWMCWLKYDWHQTAGGRLRIFNSQHSRGKRYAFRTHGNINRFAWSVTNENGNNLSVYGDIDKSKTWNHVAYTWVYKGDDTTIKCYINGNLQQTEILAGRIAAPDIDIRIGYWDSHFYEGLMDEFKLYFYAVDATEISDHYEKYRTRVYDLGKGTNPPYIDALSQNPNKGMKIVSNGKPNASIIVSGDRPYVLDLALKEFRKYIKKISNVDLPVHNSIQPGINIYIGDSFYARKAYGRRLPSGDSKEGFYIGNRGKKDQLIIAGREQIGTLFAVYTFLEGLGCRFFSPIQPHDEKNYGEEIPTMSTISIKDLDVEQHPSFAVRCCRLSCDSWRYKNKGNFISYNDERLIKNGFKHIRGIHTWPKIIHYRNHPQYFAMIDGKRDPNGHLCTTSPGLVKDFADNFVDNLMSERSLAHGYGGFPKDGAKKKWCRCANCEAVYGNDDFEFGEYLQYASHRYIDFMAEVAKVINETDYSSSEIDYSSKKVMMGAYMNYSAPYSWDMPELPDNITLWACYPRWCAINKSMADPDSALNQMLVWWFETWKGKVSDIVIYDYLYKHSWRDLPLPIHKQIVDTYRFYKQIGVSGYTTQASVENFGIQGLLYYLVARLSWDVDMNVNEFFNDYYDKYFQESAQHVRDYYEAMFDSLENAEGNIYTAIPNNARYNQRRFETILEIERNKYDNVLKIFTPTVLSQMEEAIYRAENAAKSDRVIARVRELRIGYDFTRKMVNVMMLDDAYKIEKTKPRPDHNIVDKVIESIEDCQDYCKKHANKRVFYYRKDKTAHRLLDDLYEQWRTLR